MASTTSSAAGTPPVITSIMPPIRKPADFLVLAPVQSASYPISRESSISTSTKPVPEPSAASPVIMTAPATPEIDEVSTDSAVSTVSTVSTPSRSSSVSSTGNRFLKLGPVHWGGEPGVGDWAE
ncbi:MAG: hypothetical protein M1832_005233 [Thelocarpon impressellum]|nr:MAG: hypothetical protein M1832_005233 [Thelocarpon impressellum]